MSNRAWAVLFAVGAAYWLLQIPDVLDGGASKSTQILAVLAAAFGAASSAIAAWNE